MAVTKEIATRELLNERGKTHGDFTVHARITQRLENQVTSEPGWLRLTDCQKEAIHMFFHKIGRAVAGDANFADHWDDIAGYAKLVSDRCKDESFRQDVAALQGELFSRGAMGVGSQGSGGGVASEPDGPAGQAVSLSYDERWSPGGAHIRAQTTDQGGISYAHLPPNNPK